MKNRRTHRMRRLENRVAQLERMASAYTVVIAIPEDADRLMEERIKPRWMTPQEWASTPIFLPKRVLSNMVLFEDGSLRPAHVKTPGDEKLNGWAIPVAVKRLKEYEKMRAASQKAINPAEVVVVDHEEWAILSQLASAWSTHPLTSVERDKLVAKLASIRTQAIAPEGGST